MRSICFAMLLSLTSAAFADTDTPEDMTVSGSRIPTTSFGPISFNGGPIGGDHHGCAQPGCGADPDDTGFGSALSQQQKNKNNKDAKDKAKAPENKLAMAAAIVTDSVMIKALMDWIKGFQVDSSLNFHLKVTTPHAQIDGGGCVQYHSKLNPDSPDAKDFCVEHKYDTETVKKANGSYETQLKLQYRIYNECYWEKTCGVEEITFIAGSVDELKGFLNETIGYSYY